MTIERTTKSPVHCLVFDLGGVIVPFRGMEAIAELLQRDLVPGGSSLDASGRQTLLHRWLMSPTVRAWETGQLDTPAFAARLIDEFELAISERGLVDDLSGWIEPPTASAIGLLSAARARHRLVGMSNTNPLHGPTLERQLGAYFERLFLSHQTGLLKPDRAAFDHVARALGLEPRHLLFLDDSAVNVEAASRAGFQAICVQGPDDAHSALAERHLL